MFWVVIGLLGGTRVERLHGHGVLTFHLPFIIAAMALGGPTAGAIVAMVSTFEAREIREAPWYGVLANHAALTLAAIIGGVVLVGTRVVLSTGVIGVDPNAVELIAIVLGALVLTVTTTALVAGTVILRDHLTVPEAVRVFDFVVSDHRGERGRARLDPGLHVRRGSGGGPPSSAPRSCCSSGAGSRPSRPPATTR